MKAPWQAGMVIKIKNPFHTCCLRPKPQRGKRARIWRFCKEIGKCHLADRQGRRLGVKLIYLKNEIKIVTSIIIEKPVRVLSFFGLSA
jgi:hypothetical protein